MSVYQGTFYARVFQFTDTSTGNAINITGWQFRAMFRTRPEDDEVLLELTTGNGGFTISDAVAGEVRMSFTAAQTEALPAGKLFFDVLRSDGGNGDTYLFGGKIRVRQPVTRDE